MFDNDLREMDEDLKASIKEAYNSGKVIKSYALDKETIETLEKFSKDLGVKSRSEALRYIIKEFNEWQEDKQRNARN